MRGEYRILPNPLILNGGSRQHSRGCKAAQARRKGPSRAVAGRWAMTDIPPCQVSWHLVTLSPHPNPTARSNVKDAVEILAPELRPGTCIVL